METPKYTLMSNTMERYKFDLKSLEKQAFYVITICECKPDKLKKDKHPKPQALHFSSLEQL